jgi:eukaryotic-like serine/threonine-protein kinase
MNCPSCHSPLEHNARFCGVCGYRLQARGASPPQGVPPGGRQIPNTPGAPSPPQIAKGSAAGRPDRPQAAPPSARLPKARLKGDEIYINQKLNNRFLVESKIGEGGFGAVYRGVQLATGRKVALKLLHPEMTKDENLVMRFRREGTVLCTLRDAHTITTYDFDQTPDGTLYIAMELLEGKSLHQLFHEQAPLEWRRVFKILTEMCSSLAEAHAQGIVHRDLKPENVYLESRPGNPEFVKILDFGIAKVMRGDAIDPQSPQLTATGQTLGTLEYMSPEQLMGKQLDGRSDIYALGVVAYEMITGRLPFPDAKGPAGLITAQLKQTPIPPSQANPKAGLPQKADRAILKCLEKDKNNRFPNVSELSNALQDVLNSHSSADLQAIQHTPDARAASAQRIAPPDMLETRRGDPPANLAPPPMPVDRGAITHRDQTPMPLNHGNAVPQQLYQGGGSSPFPQTGSVAPPYQHGRMPGAPPMVLAPTMPGGRSLAWMWWIIGLLMLGAGVGAAIAIFTN